MRLNIQKWNADRIDLETRIKALKNAIRCPDWRDVPCTRWDPELKKPVPSSYKVIGGTCNEYHDLWMLKSKATYLYQLRAGSRGKTHSNEGEPYQLFGEYALPDLEAVG